MADYPDFTGAAQKLLDQQAQINQLTAEIARLRTGEEDGYDPLVRPTPGQWLRKFNQSPAAERLAVVARVIDACARASTCFEMNHDARIRQLEELLRIAHETSNRSESERAAAVQRAEQAEQKAGDLAETYKLERRRGDARAEERNEAGAAIDRARALASRWAVLRAYGSAATELRAALDGTEQPTTAARPRDCLFSREGRPCSASDSCATCDPKPTTEA